MGKSVDKINLKMRNTIKFYRKLETEKLQLLLQNLETAMYNVDYIINQGDNDTTVLEKSMIDYEIDTHLIRMELNKRLWASSN